MTKPTRRDFLKMLGAASLGGVIPLSMPRNSHAATFNDYRATVCVFLLGGNDSVNMILPTTASGGAGHDNYASIRGNLAVANNDLSAGINLNGNLLNAGSGNPYYSNGNTAGAYLKGLYPVGGSTIGVNGLMPELFRLLEDGDAVAVTNVGTLVEPVTKATLDTAALPQYLFAHNHQQRELETGQADNLGLAGWAGRLYDQWVGVNGGHAFGMNISFGGNRRIVTGDQSVPLILNSSKPVNFTRMDKLTKAKQVARRNMHLDLHAQPSGNPFQSLYGQNLLKSFGLTDLLVQAWDSAPTYAGVTGPYGEPLFDVPDAATLGIQNSLGGSLIEQMSAVAKMINYGNANGLKRQFFFVGIGGFDTHGNQISKHPMLLREISLALWKFQRAMDSVGLRNNVLTYTLSDFGRTVSNNGDGTDHAWGGHQIVMGGPVTGGPHYGTLPDFTLGGADDYSTRGRFIPQFAADQYQATIARWFGVDDALMPTLFPNIDNFSARYGNFVTVV